ncbi:MAG: xanthine dehydrogenase family protein molybdopterin-binding subunit [Acidobacteria bacterium]|nr:xanthine dehydrogenase family protein molybdopterin-binding subunit [Acidobacteriota bacterium]
MKYIGKETSRVDGFDKVTGRAKYSAEFQVKNLAYGYLVQSTIAKGTITSIDTSAADKATGVLKIYTHLNSLKVEDRAGSMFRALQSADIKFSGQPIALVVAETYEQARYAANLVKAEYASADPSTDLKTANKTAANRVDRNRAKPRGNPKEAFDNSAVKVEAEYTIPIEHHAPMELPSATAFWEGDKLMMFDKSQGVYGVRDHLKDSFGIPAENITVVSLFVGGAFGSNLRPHQYPFLTAMAARELKRPVKTTYTRRQTFVGNGYRPYTFQKVSVGASKDGKLQSIIHESESNTSSFEDFSEGSSTFGRTLYACPNYDSPYNIIRTDLPTPTWMRAPGAVSGAFALESAIDELAYKLKIDPIEIRRINYSETDPDTGKPFSSKELMECFNVGAKKFGWEKRPIEPRSMREGDWLVGWGVGIGTWGAWQAPATATITLRADGTATVGSATADIGPGTYTTMTMIAAENLGIPMERVKFELGKTTLPQAPSQGGSITTSSVGAAIYGGSMVIKQKLFDMANKDPKSSFAGSTVEDVELKDGNLALKKNSSKFVSVADLMKANGLTEITETHQSMPSAERAKYTTLAHGVQFIEVKVDEAIGKIKVTRVIEAAACGKIINPKTSHSQEIGGIIGGIGMALSEETKVDHRYGRMITTNFADYHMPVHADIFSIKSEFVEEEDKIVNPLGAKGMGELCLVGVPAAIANAIFHATGKRIRELPITPDKLMGGEA